MGIILFSIRPLIRPRAIIGLVLGGLVIILSSLSFQSQPWLELHLLSRTMAPNISASILEPLMAAPASQEGFAWTEGDGSDRPFYTLGTWSREMVLDMDDPILDVKTEAPYIGGDGATFNPSVLKLPRGSKWGFVCVARGPRRIDTAMQLNGVAFQEESLIA